MKFQKWKNHNILSIYKKYSEQNYLFTHKKRIYNLWWFKK